MVARLPRFARQASLDYKRRRREKLNFKIFLFNKAMSETVLRNFRYSYTGLEDPDQSSEDFEYAERLWAPLPEARFLSRHEQSLLDEFL